MRTIHLHALALASASFLTGACGRSSAAPPDASSKEAGAPRGDGGGAHPDGSRAHSDAGQVDAKRSESGHKDGDASNEGGQPISAPDDTWTWVDFPESKCASGTATGIAVSPHAGATQLLIYFEGGGQCVDAATCWGPSPTANNVAGYDATTFQTAKQLGYPALVRSTPGSPFSAMNMVYIPYCTGDLHFGTIEANLASDGGAIPTYFWGAKDVDMFLARLVPTFPGQARVYSLGTSAGGFGSFLDYDKIVNALGVRVDIIDDSGPPLTHVGQSGNSGAFAVWGGVAPAGCTGCNSFLDVMKFDRQTQPNSKLGFLSFAEDTVISVDFGYTLASYGPAIESLFSTNFGSDPNVATYIVGDDPGHVVESQPPLAPDYLPWLTDMVNGPGWASSTFDAGLEGGS